MKRREIYTIPKNGKQPGGKPPKRAGNGRKTPKYASKVDSLVAAMSRTNGIYRHQKGPRV